MSRKVVARGSACRVVVGKNGSCVITKEAGRIFYDFDGFCLEKQGDQGLKGVLKLLNSCGAVIHTETWVNLVNLYRDLIYDHTVNSGQTVRGILRGWPRWRSFQPRCRKAFIFGKFRISLVFWSIQIPHVDSGLSMCDLGWRFEDLRMFWYMELMKQLTA